LKPAPASGPGRGIGARHSRKSDDRMKSDTSKHNMKKDSK
jgi:hypothetical protein